MSCPTHHLRSDETTAEREARGRGRGNSRDRRRRREWLWTTFRGPDGEVRCHHCGGKFACRSDFEVDRYPLCGHMGGTYRRGNIVPSHPSCNHSRCSGCSGDAWVPGATLGEEAAA